MLIDVDWVFKKYIYICIYNYTYIYIYTRTYSKKNAYIDIYIYIYVFFTLVFFQKNTYIYIYTHTYFFNKTHIHIWIYICIYVYINTGISGDFLSPFPLKARKNRSTSSTQPSFGSPSLSGSMHRCRKSLGPQRGVVGSQATKSEPLILRAEKKNNATKVYWDMTAGEKNHVRIAYPKNE